MTTDDQSPGENIDNITPNPNTSRDFWQNKKAAIFWWSISMALLFLVLWPSIIVTILPGHVGVLYRRFLGGTEMNRIFQEGTHAIFPWDRMYVFDTRLQEELHTLNVLTNRGLKLEVDVTVIYHPLPDNTPLLLTTVGTNYREKLVVPMLTSSVRDVAAKYSADDFFSSAASQISDEILVTMTGILGRNPVVIDNLLIRKIRLPEPLSQAINNTLVAKQKIMEQQFMVQQAAENYKRKYIDASAVSMTQKIVNERMSEAFLRWQGIEATRALAESGNSKTVLFGGKDGLPVILNLDGASSSQENKAQGASAPANDAKGKTQTNRQMEQIQPMEPLQSVNPTPPMAPPQLVKPTQPTGTELNKKWWLDAISPENLEQLSKNMEQAIGIPLYSHTPPTNEQGEQK